MSASEAPVLLTRICSSWRMIALSSPRIWTRLHITIPLTKPVPEPDNAGGNFDTLVGQELASPRSLVHIRSEAIREWLSLSGACPLSISLTSPDFVFLPPGTDTHMCSEVIFQTIIPFANRWKDIELTMPEYMYEQFNQHLSIDMLPSIRFFRAELLESSPPFINNSDLHYEPPIFFRSPNLAKLSFSKGSWSETSWEREVPTTTWNRLTCLSLHSLIQDVEVFGLLGQCHNIVGCKLTISRSWQLPLEEMEADPRLHRFLHATIDLPHLRSFSIVDGGDMTIMAKLFRSINAPALTYIEYLSTLYSQNSNEPTDSPSTFPLLALIAQAPLTKFTLDPHNIGLSDIKACIRTGRSIKNLTIGREPYTSDPQPTPIFDYPDRWDIMLLSSGNNGNDGLRADPLLPDLETLVAYDLHNPTDTELLSLITDRIDAWKRGLVNAPLKHVKLHFQRDRQLDIVDEAVSYAKVAGIDLRLELQYPTGKPKHLDSRSILFGLTSEDRTWRVMDIEESIPGSMLY